MKKYRIHWKALKTGATGNGTGTFDEVTAKDVAQKLNEENKIFMIHHWIEEVERD